MWLLIIKNPADYYHHISEVKLSRKCNQFFKDPLTNNQSSGNVSAIEAPEVKVL